MLDNQAYDANIDDWVEVTLPWSEAGNDIPRRLGQKFKNIASIKFPPRIAPPGGGHMKESQQGLTLKEDAEAFFENVAGKGKATAARIAIVTDMDELIRGGVS